MDTPCYVLKKHKLKARNMKNATLLPVLLAPCLRKSTIDVTNIEVCNKTGLINDRVNVATPFQKRYNGKYSYSIYIHVELFNGGVFTSPSEPVEV